MASPSFPNSIVEKLGDSNYLNWRQYFEPIMKSHKLQRFVINRGVPSQCLTEHDRVVGIVNSEYEAWEVHDQTQLVWLLRD